MNRILAALALACVCSPAMALDAVEKGDKLVIVPWGDWLVAIAQTAVQVMLPILLPIIAAYIIQAIRKVHPWAAMLLTQKRVEMMLQAGADYGVNAVKGAAKGQKLSFPVANRVIRVGTQYLIDTAPRAAIEAAGGAEGIAQRIFRKIDLDDTADEENTLLPAVEWLNQNVPRAKAVGRV